MANLCEFGSSLEATRAWIDELMAILQTDESHACRAFRVVGHELRDQLTTEEAADLAAQLPLLLRGVFFEGWRPNGKPASRSKKDFLENVAESYKEISNKKQIESIVRDFFRFLDRKVSPGEIRDIVTGLPKQLRDLWPEYSGDRRSA
jgi:uncharacterized protein (DUF2267 family)